MKRKLSPVSEERKEERLAYASAVRTLTPTVQAILHAVCDSVLDDYMKHTGDKDPSSVVMDALDGALQEVIELQLWKHVSDVTGYCRERDSCTDPEKHNLNGRKAKAKGAGA